MQLVNLASGKPETLDEQGVLDAIAAGTHAVPGAKLLVNPSGELVWTPAEDAQANLSQYGYQVPTQAQLTDVAQQKKYGEGTANVLKAGAEGLARGASFGLSDVLEPAVFGTTKEAIRERRERNPASATVGEIGGAVGSALLAPEFSPAGFVSKAGTRVAESLTPGVLGEAASLGSRVLNAAGQIGAQAVGSAVEGAAYGFGQGVSEAALGDPTLNAEKLAAHVGYGALFGGALGGLIKSGELLIPKSIEKAQAAINRGLGRLTGKISESGEFEPGLAEKALAKTSEALTGEPAEDVLEYAKKVAGGEILGKKEYASAKRDFGTSVQEIYDSVNKATLDASTKIRPQEIGTLLADADPAAALAESSRLTQSIDGVLTEFGDNPELYTPSAGKSLARMKEAFEKAQATERVQGADGIFYNVPKSPADSYLALNDLKKRLYEDIQSLKNGSFTDKKSVGLINELYTQVQGSLKDEASWGPAAVRYESYNSALAQHLDNKKLLETEFMRKVKTGGRDRYVVNPRKVSEFFNMINDPRGEFRADAARNFFKSAQDVVGEIDKTYQSAAFEKFDKEGLLDTVGKGISQAERAQNLVAEQPNMGFGGLDNLAQKYLAGDIHSLTQVALRAVTDPYAVINRLSNLERAVQKTSARINEGSQAIFSTSGSALTKLVGPAAGQLSKADTEKAYDSAAKHTEEFNGAPAKALDHIDWVTRDLYHVAPNTSSALQMTALKGAQFLGTKLPRSTTPRLPLDPPFKPTMPQMIKFNRYHQAVSRPLSALSELEAGQVHPETLEVLAQVYPTLYTEMQTEVMNAMTEAIADKRPVNYQKRLALSAFLGQPIDSSMVPGVAQANQAVLRAHAVAKAAAEAPKTTASGLGKLGLSDRLKTNLQTSAERGMA